MTASLVNHFWQTTWFVVAAAALAWALRRHAARVRFGVWLAASLKFLVPFGALTALGARLPWFQAHAVARAATAAVALSYETMMVPMSAAPMAAVPPAPQAAGVPWAWILGGVWLAGSAVLAARWYGQWRRAARVAREGAPADLPGLSVRVTEAAIELGVFGVLRPVLVVPDGMRERLTPAQWEAVLAHERWHLRRRDNLWAALHRAVEAAFWFHPFVWWVGVRLVAERERACDEAVLREGVDARTYASGILTVCRDAMEPLPLACAAGVASGPLQERVRRILDGGWGRELSRRSRLALAVLAATALLGPMAAGMAQRPVRLASLAIRLSPPRTRPQVRVNPAGLRLTSQTLRQMVMYAYGLHEYQLEGLPAAMRGRSWTLLKRFDLDATSRAPASAHQLRAMLQGVLKRRFGLEIGRTTKLTPVFALKPIPGARFEPASANAKGRVQTADEFVRELNMPRLMGRLAPVKLVPLKRIVINRTGLTGSYVFAIRSTPEDWSNERSILKAEGFELNPEAVRLTTYTIKSAKEPAAN